MSDGQVPDYSGVPESIMKRWVRPPNARVFIVAIVLIVYFTFGSLVRLVLRIDANDPVGSSVFNIVDFVLFSLFDGILITWMISRLLIRPTTEHSPAVADIRDLVLARLGHDVAVAYPLRFASLIALCFLGLIGTINLVNAIWFSGTAWTQVIGCAICAAAAFAGYLISRRQYRRDLQWALDYEVPPLPQQNL